MFGVDLARCGLLGQSNMILEMNIYRSKEIQVSMYEKQLMNRDQDDSAVRFTFFGPEGGL